MHELSLAESIVRIALRARGRAGRWRGWSVKVGHLRQVVPAGARVRVRARRRRARRPRARSWRIEEVPGRRPLPGVRGGERAAGVPAAVRRPAAGWTSSCVRGEELLVDALELDRGRTDHERRDAAWRLNRRPRRGGGPHPLDLGGDELRRRLRVDHRGGPAEHRGRAARRHPRAPQGPPPQQGALAHARRRGVPQAVPPGARRRRSTRRSCSSSRARSRTRTSTATATGPRSATTRPRASR